MISEGSNRTLAETWQAHSSGEKPLPWEDAARLEYAWVGHCDNTKFNASRFFEETVLELAGSKAMTTENVAKALTALKDKQILSETLFARADLVRKERNRYAHTAGLNAELEYTLRLIAVMREVADLGQPPVLGRLSHECGDLVVHLFFCSVSLLRVTRVRRSRFALAPTLCPAGLPRHPHRV